MLHEVEVGCIDLQEICIFFVTVICCKVWT